MSPLGGNFPAGRSVIKRDFQKNMVKIIVFALQLFAIGTLYAQAPPTTAAHTTPEQAVIHPGDTMAVRARLEELLQYIRTGDLEKASTYLVYRGKDTARRWNDVLHYSDEHDRKEVGRIAKVLKEFLKQTGSSYHYQLFLFDAEGPWYVWNLTYDIGGNTPSIAFAFKKIGNNFCLADIDE